MRENKPDWAERLQRTFKRKYDRGYEDGYNKGWNEGFVVGTKKANAEQLKVLVKRIEKEISQNKQNISPGVLAGLHSAITIIRRKR